METCKKYFWIQYPNSANDDEVDHGLSLSGKYTYELLDKITDIFYVIICPFELFGYDFENFYE